jgi:gliding motility-associated transport system permease protein
MRKFIVLLGREVRSYFYSPIAYIVLVFFLLVSGVDFYFQVSFMNQRQLQYTVQESFFNSVFFWFAFVLIFPLITMRLFSEEFKMGTIEPLMTAPVEETDVVIGKFLGALGFFCVLLAPTLFYVVLLRLYSRMDFGPIFSGYLGILLVGALFVSIGLFCSSLTRSQVVAAVTAVAILFLITIAPWWALREGASTLSGGWRSVVDQGVYNRYVDFSKGVIDSGHVVFFVAVTAVFLFLTTKVLESRRWR